MRHIAAEIPDFLKKSGDLNLVYRSREVSIASPLNGSVAVDRQSQV